MGCERIALTSSRGRGKGRPCSSGFLATFASNGRGHLLSCWCSSRGSPACPAGSRLRRRCGLATRRLTADVRPSPRLPRPRGRRRARRVAGDRLVAGAQRLATWPKGDPHQRPPREPASLRARSAVLAGSAVVVFVAALLTADLVWRDQLPRSAIAAGGLLVLAVVLFWLFGSSGSKTAFTVLSAIGLILVAAGTALNLDQRLPARAAPGWSPGRLPRQPRGRVHGRVRGPNTVRLHRR